MGLLPMRGKLHARRSDTQLHTVWSFAALVRTRAVLSGVFECPGGKTLEYAASAWVEVGSWSVACVPVGTMYFGGGEATGRRGSSTLMHTALEAGINCWDTSNMYNDGDSEIGRCR